MEIIKCNDYNEVCLEASKIIIDKVNRKPDAILGLATGSSPLGVYKNIIKSVSNKEVSFKNVSTFNLDEYCDIDRNNEQSYYTYMQENLFKHIDINQDNINIPYVKNNDITYCTEYNDKLLKNKIDVQLLGIGANGHIGFNEPNTPFTQETFIVELTSKTREDNKRFFNSLDEVPTHAITMGIKNIMDSKEIVIIATGLNKAEIVKRLLTEGVSEELPASILHNHKNVTLIVDKEALSMM